MYKILIRPLAIEDAHISWKWRNDSEVWAQTGNSPDKPITLDIEIEWIKKVIKEEATKRFAITVDDQYVGNVQLTDVTDSEAQFHIFIGEKSFWGKGVANQATYQILNYAKEILKLTEVYLYVKKSNVSAIKVYEKNSFIKEEQDAEKIKMTCNLIDLTLPMVSIFCMVYNHEKYISDAIEGFLMQKNNFNTVIVIGEDFSKDESRKVINSFVAKYPGKFKLIYHDINIGAIKNQEIIFQNCKGNYIAMCEGDDYWTDPLKLQKQVDFLESHPDYSMVCHNAQIIYESIDRKPTVFSNKAKTQDISMNTVINEWTIPTASMVFRNEYITKLPIWFGNIYSGDYSLALLLRYQGKICYFKEVMSVYRISYGGTSASATVGKDLEFISKQHTLLLNFFNEESKYIYKDLIELKIKSIEKNFEFNKLKNTSVIRAFVSFPKIFTTKVFQKVKAIFVNL